MDKQGLTRGWKRFSSQQMLLSSLVGLIFFIAKQYLPHCFNSFF